MVAGGADPGLASSPGAAIRVGEVGEEARERGVRLRLAEAPDRAVDRRAAGPLPAEARLDGLQHDLEEAVHGKAALGQAAGRGDHVGQPARAEALEQLAPGIEGGRNRGCQQAVGRNRLDAALPHRGDAGCGGRRALARERIGPVLGGDIDKDRDFAGGAILRGLEHLERESHGARRVRRIAALRQHLGADLGGEIVPGAHGAAEALEGRTSGEAHGAAAASLPKSMKPPGCATSGGSTPRSRRTLDRGWASSSS